ncbi:hypothetical protein [Allomesorhizobium camelthorni]|uniref:Uncharacterized protein n=1 Tax=Allomesorhizobium camelthorni TaxID=475069 RepID=A0A6G4WIM7_9HYPH|nr:hypothetical protein [Mesorhizobium camelthorni]NGO54053.1 hypothetical protein [Mesorhizobium camelthorni]
MIENEYGSELSEVIQRHMSCGLPVEMLTSVSFVSARRLRFTSIGRDRRGECVTTIKRTIDLERRELDGGDTFISHPLRGCGHGRQIARNCYQLAESLELVRMNIHAVLDGRYAWARCGFTPTIENWPSVKKQLVSIMETPTFRAHPAERLHAMRIVEPNSPWSLYMLTRITELVQCGEFNDHGSVTFGRALLCQLTGWKGTFDMANERSRAILWEDGNG